MNFDTLLVGTVPVMIVIVGLVEFIKSLGLAGKPLTIASLGLGLLFGLAYQVSVSGVPVAYGGWFEAIFFGLAIGLVTSGFYKFVDDRFPPVLTKPPF